mgnify:CR=1 FL=1
MKKRQPLDTVVNPAGEILLQLCKSSGLRILNGRYADDQPGKFTCHKCNGTSVVDYFIAHHSLLSYISSFKVTEFQELYSDHAPLTASLSCRYDLNSTKIKQRLNKGPSIVVWDEDAPLKYLSVLQSEPFSSRLQRLEAHAVNGSIDTMVQELNDIMVDAAKASLRVIQPTRKNRKSVNSAQMPSTWNAPN